VSQVDNKLEIPVGSHSPLRREPRALPWHHIHLRGEGLESCPDIKLNPEDRASDLTTSSHSTLRRGPRALSFPDICNYLFSPQPPRIGSLQRFPLPLDTAQRQGFPNREGSYDATISLRSKYSPISVGIVMDRGRYLDMPILIKT